MYVYIYGQFIGTLSWELLSGLAGNSSADFISETIMDDIEQKITYKGRTITCQASRQSMAFPIMYIGEALDKSSGITAMTARTENFDNHHDACKQAITYEGRTITCRASPRSMAFPIMYVGKTLDQSSGITAMTARTENYANHHDACEKSLANLLVILRERGLINDQGPKPRPDSRPITILSPEPDPIAAEPEHIPKPELPDADGASSDETGRVSDHDIHPSVWTTRVRMSVYAAQVIVSILEYLLYRYKAVQKAVNFTLRGGVLPLVIASILLILLNRCPVLPFQMSDLLSTVHSILTVPTTGWIVHIVWKIASKMGSFIFMLYESVSSLNGDVPPPLTKLVLIFFVFLALFLPLDNIIQRFPIFKLFLTDRGPVEVLVIAWIFNMLDINYVNILSKVVNFILKISKSWTHFRGRLLPFGSVLEVVPDKMGSYARYTMETGHPTNNMLTLRDNYLLTSPVKGIAFILNNFEFVNNERHGSNVDLCNIDHLFCELGYKNKIHENLTGNEIVESIREFAAMFNEASYDSAVVVLMSHGNTGVILGTDLANVKLRDLERELEGDRCPGLKGKPKMYFVQACRGEFQIVISDVADRPYPNAPQGEGFKPANLDVVPDNEFARRIADVADVHIAFATTEGHASLRSEVIGSFFVQALCEVFFANAHQDNLDTLMNKVAYRVDRMKGKFYDNTSGKWINVKQTTECIKRGMRKSLYFLPKYSR